MWMNEPVEPSKREHTEADFSREEVRLANRNSGLLLEGLRHDITPSGMHYLLIHFDVPYVADKPWSLEIAGCVERPLTISLDDLQSEPARTLAVTFECAGNGRAAMSPRWPSQPWFHEAVGTAQWTGTPLAPLLRRAGLLPVAADVVFHGIDRGLDGGIEHNYARSLSPTMALSEDVLLVWAMNGQPLLPQHGYPLRLVVPGWYGMASVKWLNRIEVIDRPFEGYQQVRTYLYRTGHDDPSLPVTAIRVKSLMIPPGIPDWYTRGRTVERGPVQLFGRAWSGGGVGVAKVEVSVDGEWREATLDRSRAQGKYAWTGWHFDWMATLGVHELACRATDAKGDAQPLEARWDNGGFGNNAVQRVEVMVR
jgi:DMSO/TMAO reductase YedYZ molybdopterin-dependent catalytic subunit